MKLMEKNEKVEEVIRMPESDFNIDPEYFDMLIKRTKDKIEETKKEEQWDIEKNKVALNKVKNKFYDALDFQKFTVKAMRTDSYVTTFRVPKMSTFLKDNINRFKDILESEILAKEENDNQEGDGINQDADAQEGDKQKEKTAKNTN